MIFLPRGYMIQIPNSLYKFRALVALLELFYYSGYLLQVMAYYLVLLFYFVDGHIRSWDLMKKLFY
jgi:hypothetical protein